MRVVRQHDIVSKLEAMNGTVLYDRYPPNHIVTKTVWPILGDDYLYNVRYVGLARGKAGKMRDFRFLSKLPCVRSFSASDAADFDDTDVKILSGWKQLEDAHLGSTGITDSGLNSLVGLPNLWLLRLNHTEISISGLEDVVMRLDLELVDVSGTAVRESEVVEMLRRCKKETFVELDNSRFVTKDGPQSELKLSNRAERPR